MAIHTTYEIRDDNYAKTGERIETTYVNRVLHKETEYYHVPSDNAMLDSGESRIAYVWDGEAVARMVLSHGRPSASWGHASVDATPEIETLAELWRVARSVADSIVADDQHWHKERMGERKIARGVRVKVIKGRKVKISTTWYVDRIGENDYGEYAHLSSKPNGLGEYVRYINPDNLQALPPDVIPPRPWTAHVLTVATLAAKEFNRAAAVMLADAMMESGLSADDDRIADLQRYLSGLDSIDQDAPHAFWADFDAAHYDRTEHQAYADVSHWHCRFVCDPELSSEDVCNLASAVIAKRFKNGSYGGRGFSSSFEALDRTQPDGGTLRYSSYNSIADN